ncbi:MAG: NAD(P)-dependent oxidoreductase [bacterium]|nr:NAD(P)-dependent oxidoreductase [bacterium]
MKILVTGGFGYIGGRLCQHLQAQGHEVTLTSRRPSQDWPVWAQGFEVRSADTQDASALAELCGAHDALIHLASLNEVYCGQDPVAAVEVNSVDTLRWVLAAQGRVERLVYFSTAHVYQAPLVGHINESSPCRPRHPYAYSHRAAEDYVLAAKDNGHFAAAVVRLSNSFGAPADVAVDRWTLLVNDLCVQAVQKKQLELRSSGLQHRDFVTMQDVLAGTVHLLSLPADQLGDGLFNLGSGQSESILSMTERVAARAEVVLGFRPPVLRPEPKPSEVEEPLFFSIDKLKATGFVPQNDLDREIDETLLLCQRELADAPR